MHEIEVTWQRIHGWLEVKAPAVLQILRPGATEATLARVERTLGVVLPDDLRASLRIHDGESEGGFDLMSPWSLLSCKEIVQVWELMAGLPPAITPDDPYIPIIADPGVRRVWWDRGWIPVTDNGSGDNECVDLAPAPGGTRGQVIRFTHDESERRRIAPSYAAYLERFYEALLSDHFVVEDEARLRRRRKPLGAP